MLHKYDHQGVGVPRLLLGYHDLDNMQMTIERIIWTLATSSTHQGHILGQYGMVVVVGNQGHNWRTIEPTWGYLNTLQGVQGFCHCPKGSKGFRLGLGQIQKVSFDIDNYLTLKGSSRGTNTHLLTSMTMCYWHQ